MDRIGWDGMGWDGMTCSSKLKPKSFEEEYKFDEFGLLEFHPSCVHSFIFIHSSLKPCKNKNKTRVLGFGQVQKFWRRRRRRRKLKKRRRTRRSAFFPIFQEGKKRRKNKVDMILH
jgi:hypothetical protein